MSSILRASVYSIGFAFLLSVSTVSHADTVAGTSELSVYGTATHQSGDTFAFVNIDYGRFFTDQLRGIFGISVFGSTFGDGSINTGARAGFAYDFRPQGNTAYVGATAFVADVSEANDTLFGYVFLGYRHWVGENAAFFYQAGYERNFEFDFDRVRAEFGLTLFF